MIPNPQLGIGWGLDIIRGTLTVSELTAGTDGKRRVTREPIFMQMFSWKGIKDQRTGLQ